MADTKYAPLFNVGLDFINENNKNIYANGWKMLSQYKKDFFESSAALQDEYGKSRCEDVCGFLTWEQDVDGVTMIAAQLRCQDLNSKALEMWINPQKPNEIYEFKYSCWESKKEDAISPMPDCTFDRAANEEYASYTYVTATCPDSHPIVADCLMLAVASGASLFFALVFAPMLLLLGSWLYIRAYRTTPTRSSALPILPACLPACLPASHDHGCCWATQA
jgi:hypothetical protein